MKAVDPARDSYAGKLLKEVTSAGSIATCRTLKKMLASSRMEFDCECSACYDKDEPCDECNKAIDAELEFMIDTEWKI